MGQGPEQIATTIHAALDRLGDNFEELEDKVKSATDWRTQFDRRPGVMVALAFTGGLLLSILARSLGGSRDDP